VVLYVATTLDPADWAGFLPAKWRQMCRAAAALPAGGKGVEFRMLGFARDGVYEGSCTPGNLAEWGPPPSTTPSATRQRAATSRPAVKRHRTESPSQTAWPPALSKASDAIGFDAARCRAFVDRYHRAGRTFLVVGTHGEGGYFLFNSVRLPGSAVGQAATVRKGVSYPVRAFVDDVTPPRLLPPGHGVLHRRQRAMGVGSSEEPSVFAAVVLDCCVMSELHTVDALGAWTPYVVACQGWMWSEDTDTELSVFSSRCLGHLAAATLSSNNRLEQDLPSTAPRDTPLLATLRAIVDDYVAATPQADAAVLRTAPVRELLQWPGTTVPAVLTDFRRHAERNSALPMPRRVYHPACIWAREDADTASGQYLLDVRALLLALPSRPRAARQARDALCAQLDRVVAHVAGPSDRPRSVGYTLPALGGVSVQSGLSYTTGDDAARAPPGYADGTALRTDRRRH
jgi:hypothetical protein